MALEQIPNLPQAISLGRDDLFEISQNGVSKKASAQSILDLVGPSVTNIKTVTPISGGPILGVGTLTLEANGVTNGFLDFMPPKTIKANLLSTTAAPTDSTLSSLLDADISNVQGSIIYRGASGWVSLPPGTVGQVLGTQGAGSDPSWGSVLGSGTVTQIDTTAPLSGGPITGSGSISLLPNGITNSLLATMAANSIKGNNTGSIAQAVDLTQTQLTAMVNNFTSALKGSVPASGGGASNFLRADGTWNAPPMTTSLVWGSITGTPTTIAGYGITDGVTITGSQTLTNKTMSGILNNFFSMTLSDTLTMGAGTAAIPSIVGATANSGIYFPSGAPAISISGVLAAQFAASGTAAAADTTVMTREKGDFRYLLLSGGTVTGQISGITPVAPENLTRKDYVDTKATTPFTPTAAGAVPSPASATNVGLLPTGLWGNMDLRYMPNTGFKHQVICVSDTNIVLTTGGFPNIDGYQTVSGDRILCVGQTAAAENGIYTASAGAWSRSSDANSASSTKASIVTVFRGNSYGGTSWQTSFQTNNVIDTTAMPWYQMLRTDNGVTPSNTKTLTNKTISGAANTINNLALTMMPASAILAPARLCSFGQNIDLATGGLITVDSVVTSEGDRILVAGQTTTSQNGVYIASAGPWVRSSDANSSVNIAAATIGVGSGTLYSGTQWATKAWSTANFATGAKVWSQLLTVAVADTKYAPVSAAGGVLNVKAYIRFNNPSSLVVVASSGMSIARSGVTGVYNVTLSPAMANANYIIQGSGAALICTMTSITASSFTIQMYDPNSTSSWVGSNDFFITVLA